MLQPAEATPFGAFLKDGPARIERLAAPGLIENMPLGCRAAAASVARQAAGGWSLALVDGKDFVVNSSLRELVIPRGFAVQCESVVTMVTTSRNPELRGALAALGDQAAVVRGIMSAFFHYFTAHELVHIEQGLGSDQYKDSDLYMPVVMEADYVADVAGLVIAVKAELPELAALSAFQRTILLISIHIASMHSFEPLVDGKMDSNSFSRLLIWYLHFARLTKAGICPMFDSPTFMRSWVITLPRLIGPKDLKISSASLAKRAKRPYAAASDVVLAYHREDGLYRIDRAALTDTDRVRRLCLAVIDQNFDDVRVELEEWLVNNPALLPVAGTRHDAVEWAAGALLETLEALRAPMIAEETGAIRHHIEEARDGYARLILAVRSTVARSDKLQALINDGEAALELLADAFDANHAPQAVILSPATLRRRIMSIVDQIAVEAI